jgi:hypothetical protein
VALTAERVAQLLDLRGRLSTGIPIRFPTPTERRLQLDRVLARGGRLGDSS